jgi:hypothetical protein
MTNEEIGIIYQHMNDTCQMERKGVQLGCTWFFLLCLDLYVHLIFKRFQPLSSQDKCIQK